MLKIAIPYLLPALLGAAAGAGVEHLMSTREIADIRADAATAQTKAVEAARTEEHRRSAAQQEIAENASKDRDQARADAAAAASAADGLRKQVAVYVERARNPAAPAGSTPAGDPIGMLADVLGRADQRAGELAEYADRARIAGQQCERDYDTLTAAAR
ncbi:DUF2514 family protein [Burkholderia sp. LMG 13014]|uniref:DUF2514 family protein n=1 Tax=Burkholderia sp. LMG 13014 TaxID=2709306 RepID=UPI0019662A7F|nr:DUF2514 family protein [Burkholderia sp. LMG 13014]